MSAIMYTLYPGLFWVRDQVTCNGYCTPCTQVYSGYEVKSHAMVIVHLVPRSILGMRSSHMQWLLYTLYPGLFWVRGQVTCNGYCTPCTQVYSGYEVKSHAMVIVHLVPRSILGMRSSHMQWLLYTLYPGLFWV